MTLLTLIYAVSKLNAGWLPMMQQMACIPAKWILLHYQEKKAACSVKKKKKKVYIKINKRKGPVLSFCLGGGDSWGLH